jgi:hypothetical protein
MREFSWQMSDDGCTEIFPAADGGPGGPRFTFVPAAVPADTGK